MLKTKLRSHEGSRRWPGSLGRIFRCLQLGITEAAACRVLRHEACSKRRSPSARPTCVPQDTETSLCRATEVLHIIRRLYNSRIDGKTREGIKVYPYCCSIT